MKPGSCKQKRTFVITRQLRIECFKQSLRAAIDSGTSGQRIRCLIMRVVRMSNSGGVKHHLDSCKVVRARFGVDFAAGGGSGG